MINKPLPPELEEELEKAIAVTKGEQEAETQESKTQEESDMGGRMGRLKKRKKRTRMAKKTGKRTRRTFGGDQKAAIVAEYDAAPRGIKDAVLKKHGLFANQIS